MRINEIFYSIQGEGYYTGVPAVFVRFSGCNRKCDFCDTDFSDYKVMDPTEVVAAVIKYPAKHVVLTGGEPALQITRDFISMLHSVGRFVQVETNGSLPLPSNIDWVTCSPKAQPWHIEYVDELKVIYEEQDVEEIREEFLDKEAEVFELQPCSQPDGTTNLEETIDYVMRNPHWRLSLQTHKLINIK